MRYGRIAGISWIFLIIIMGGLYFTAEHLYAPETSPASTELYMDINGHEISLEISDTAETRERGLSGRDSLAVDNGMLFVFPEAGNYGFWMKGMRFPIDIVWIAYDTVVGWEADVDPQIGVPDASLAVYYPPSPADRVLELPGGRAAALDIALGTKISFHNE